MTKLLFAKALGGFSLSSTLLFGGAGSYYLLLDEKKVINIRRIEDEGRIIKNRKSGGTWTDMKVYSKSQLTHICTGKGPNGYPECNRYLKANNVSKKVEQLFLYIGYPTHTEKWGPIYKFTFEEGIEGDQKEYHGECDDSIKIEDKGNPCADQNLPKGWKKEYFMRFIELLKLLNPE